ncbi:MAG: hypothetical protein V6006_02170 [Candidatus Dasytiphilus stammeri]
MLKTLDIFSSNNVIEQRNDNCEHLFHFCRIEKELTRSQIDIFSENRIEKIRHNKVIKK